MSAHRIIAITRCDGLSLNPKLKFQKEPAGNGGLFYLVPMNLDFSKLDGLVATVVQDHKTRPRPHGRLHE